jgi:iron complex outermembrane receptor protein
LSGQAEETLRTIVVVAENEPVDIGTPGHADAAQRLRNEVGIDGARMGGHGVEPVIRGLQQGNVRVSLDGACVTSGCPNRMDPATSYAPPGFFDEVDIAYGVETLSHGPGAPGGTVRLIRQTEPFYGEEAVRGSAGSAFESNSDTWSSWADLAGGNPYGFGRGQFQWTDASNYRDGDGNEIRSGYSQMSGAVGAGWTPDAYTRLEVIGDFTRTEDVLFAGAGMDSPESESRTLQLRGSRENLDGLLTAWRFEAAFNSVDHLMDNYSLRPLTAPMRLRAPSETITWNGTIAADLDLDPVLWTWGTNWTLTAQSAERYMGPAGTTPTGLQSILWPEADTDIFGFFTEAVWDITDTWSLTGGMRIDHVIATAADANRSAAPIGGTPRPVDLYRAYYATGDTDREEWNLGALIRTDWEWDEHGSKLYGAFSRSVRTPDASERYIASNNPVATRRWVGNPGLDPETHYQIETGLEWKRPTTRARTAIFADWTEDFILRDRARGQSGVARNDGAIIYRNVDARRWGVEAEAEHTFAERLRVHGQLAYVEATNLDENRTLPLIPPLSGQVGLEWMESTWAVGALCRMAATQDRVDTLSPLEVGPTSGWAVVDIYGSVILWKYAELRVGIRNLTDHTYSNHLNRANTFTGQAVQINEPGRTFWASLSVEF